MAFSKLDHREERGTTYVYTDGSKIQETVGYGYVLRKNGITMQAKCFQLKPENSVFQAEIRAITQAMRQVIEEQIAGKICLCVDSQAAIMAVSSIEVTDKLVHECIQALNQAAVLCSIEIKWVKSHIGTTGNELADIHAKKGALEG